MSASFPKCKLHGYRVFVMVQAGYIPRYGFYDIYQPYITYTSNLKKSNRLLLFMNQTVKIN